MALATRLSPVCAAAGPHPGALTPRQTEILAAIMAYCAFHTERDGCPASYIAERFRLDHATVRRDYFDVLYRKGWLLTPGSPARLARRPAAVI